MADTPSALSGCVVIFQPVVTLEFKLCSTSTLNDLLIGHLAESSQKVGVLSCKSSNVVENVE